MKRIYSLLLYVSCFLGSYAQGFIVVSSAEGTMSVPLSKLHSISYSESNAGHFNLKLNMADGTITSVGNAASTQWRFSQQAVESSLRGDVNGDATLSVADLTLMAYHVLGNKSDKMVVNNADVNSDGVVSVSDMTAIANRLVLGRWLEADNNDATHLSINHNNGVTDVFQLADGLAVTFNQQSSTVTIAGSTEYNLDDITAVSHETYPVPMPLSISYEDSKVTVLNPYACLGVNVTTDGAYVTVDNPDATTEITTTLSGTTTDGALLYNGVYKTTIQLDGVNITSQRGAAIDIQDGKRIALEIKKGTENTLCDYAGGSQKAALYCKGHLELDKAGTLNVTGKCRHAISAKEYIQFKNSSGTINILGAEGDGIHCQEYLLVGGFNININNVGDDCMQAEPSGEANDAGYADGSIIVRGGKLTLAPTTAVTVSGTDASYATALKCDQYIGEGGNVSISIPSTALAARGISADGDVTITGGTYSITCQANGYASGSEAYTSKGIKADGNVNLLGGEISIAMSGTGGKGVVAEGQYIQGNADGTGPQLTVTTSGSKLSTSSSSSGSTGGWGGWGGGGGRPGGGGGGFPGQSSQGSSSKAIKAQGIVNVNGGTTTVNTAADGAEGLESKTSVNINGGQHYFYCYDDGINSSGNICFNGGTTVCISYHNDAVDSNAGRSGAITIAGGKVFAYTTAGSPEEGLDCDNNSYITVKGGIAVSAGGSQGGGSSSSIGSASQGYYLGSSPSSYGSTYYYTLCNTMGEPICTYKFNATVSNRLSLLTAPNLGKGSVTVRYGTQKPSQCSESVNDVFFINPTVTTSGTTSTVTAK